MMSSQWQQEAIGRLKSIEKLMIARATGDHADNTEYEALRSQLLRDPKVRSRLPSFVRQCRTLDAFWPFIKQEADNYADRRAFIYGAFAPAVDDLEFGVLSPADDYTTQALRTLQIASIEEAWNRALERRETDPEGAITLARSLLESVCKLVLDDLDPSYSRHDDLPKLYSKVAGGLNLGPDRHSEIALKSILQGVVTVVNGLGTLRNALGDSHGRSGRLPVKPSTRHAALAVNTAGALAVFVAETYAEKTAGQRSNQEAS